MTEQKENIEAINEILNEFYKSKEKYEKTYYEKYVKKIIKSTNKSTKEKKRDFASLPKPECINCGRNVGTIFSITFDKENYRRNFVIKCGDMSDPCPLNINFFYGNRIIYENEIKLQTEALDKIKNTIILEKNNALFGYEKPDEASTLFTLLTEELKQTTDITGFLIEKNILVNHNPAKKELLYKLQDELQKEYIIPYKQFIQKFIRENNIDFCKEAVELYVNEIRPKLKEIQALKYSVNVIDYDNSNNTFHLFQRANNLDNLETTLADDEINSFVKGIVYKKTSQKTKKTNVLKSAKPKTLKLKPTIEIVEDAEEVQENV